MQRTYQEILFERVNKKNMLQIETLKQEFKSRVSEKGEFEHWKSVKINISPLHCRTIKIRRTEQNHFCPEFKSFIQPDK